MKVLKLITILLCTSTMFSQALKTNNVQAPFIEVIGKAEKEVVPNEIYINIYLKERIEKGTKITIEDFEKMLKKELELIGIPLKNLSFSDVNSVISKIGWWKEEVLANANYTLKINGAEKLKKLFEKFQKLKISNANIIKVTHSDIKEIRKENRIAAIKSAKEKADYLLSAIGEKTGKPIKVNETNNNYQNFLTPKNVNKSFTYNTLSKFRTKKEVVQFEKIKVSCAVYVKFLIK